MIVNALYEGVNVTDVQLYQRRVKRYAHGLSALIGLSLIYCCVTFANPVSDALFFFIILVAHGFAGLVPIFAINAAERSDRGLVSLAFKFGIAYTLIFLGLLAFELQKVILYGFFDDLVENIIPSNDEESFKMRTIVIVILVILFTALCIICWAGFAHSSFRMRSSLSHQLVSVPIHINTVPIVVYVGGDSNLSSKLEDNIG